MFWDFEKLLSSTGWCNKCPRCRPGPQADLLELTGAGRSAHGAAVAELSRQCQAMLEALEDPERAVFVALMDKIAGTLALKEHQSRCQDAGM
jgi:hypothetical protein